MVPILQLTIIKLYEHFNNPEFCQANRANCYVLFTKIDRVKIDGKIYKKDDLSSLKFFFFARNVRGVFSLEILRMSQQERKNNLDININMKRVIFFFSQGWINRFGSNSEKNKQSVAIIWCPSISDHFNVVYESMSNNVWV